MKWSFSRNCFLSSDSSQTTQLFPCILKSVNVYRCLPFLGVRFLAYNLHDLVHLPLLFASRAESEEERIAVETACRYGSKPDVYCSPAAEDVSVEVKIDGEGPRMGNDAKLSIVVKNQSSQPRQTTLHSQVAVMYYTGVLKNAIKKDKMPVELLPNEGLNFFSQYCFMLFVKMWCKLMFVIFFPQIFNKNGGLSGILCYNNNN